jgi:hypothetical protein
MGVTRTALIKKHSVAVTNPKKEVLTESCLLTKKEEELKKGLHVLNYNIVNYHFPLHFYRVKARPIAGGQPKPVPVTRSQSLR